MAVRDRPRRNFPALDGVSEVVRLAFPTLLVATLAAGLLLIVSGCGGNDEDDGESLKGTDWTLVSGVDAPPAAVPTVKFDGELATGFAGCNYYEGDYALDGDSIEIGGIALSAMACPGPEMETEETYLSVYAEVDGWSIEDSELVLSADGDEVLRYAAATDR
jgi:heat shock protein HslJ